MSSIPGRGNNSRMSFSSDQVSGTVFPHLNMPSFQILKMYLDHCPRGEALIISHLRFSSNEVASHVKQLPFRPLLYMDGLCKPRCSFVFYFYTNCISSTPLLRIFYSWSKQTRIRTVGLRQYSGSLAHPRGMYSIV